jgi:glucokinase
MYILIDIGGTNTRIARTDDKETFGEPIIFSTPQVFDEWFSLAVNHITSLTNGHQILTIIAGVAGTFSSDFTKLYTSPHLPHWHGINLKEKLGGWFNCEASIENDTALVGLGEAVYGSGKGYDIVSYITISTGVGGVRIVDGRIEKNHFGFEIGHQIVEGGKEIEYYLAGSSHEKRFGKPSKEISDQTFWNEVTYYTAVLAANTTMYWSPACIVFGGPVTNDINFEEVLKQTRTFTPMYPVLPIFKKSSLGALGGLYGGMAYLKILEPSSQ